MSLEERKKKIIDEMFDDYGRFQSEIILVPPFGQEVHSKYFYAYLGYNLPEDFVTKIGEWFWK